MADGPQKITEKYLHKWKFLDCLRKNTSLFKWGIGKFSDKYALLPFLELVDTLKVSRCCSGNDRLDSDADLFDQDAWTSWHNHVIRGTFKHWPGLVTG
ncbi:hypothetical protein WA026_020035 [Henosepilachna vigintioctopunctata]|uniref:Uncharacterized protein n=1 Tax=Henosepilachna vigintioctopunctata TaxID=420089 RepID=A0AAW1V231_9CUCU